MIQSKFWLSLPAALLLGLAFASTEARAQACPFQTPEENVWPFTAHCPLPASGLNPVTGGATAYLRVDGADQTAGLQAADDAGCARGGITINVLTGSYQVDGAVTLCGKNRWVWGDDAVLTGDGTFEGRPTYQVNGVVGHPIINQQGGAGNGQGGNPFITKKMSPFWLGGQLTFESDDPSQQTQLSFIGASPVAGQQPGFNWTLDGTTYNIRYIIQPGDTAAMVTTGITNCMSPSPPATCNNTPGTPWPVLLANGMQYQAASPNRVGEKPGIITASLTTIAFDSPWTLAPTCPAAVSTGSITVTVVRCASLDISPRWKTFRNVVGRSPQGETGGDPADPIEAGDAIYQFENLTSTAAGGVVKANQVTTRIIDATDVANIAAKTLFSISTTKSANANVPVMLFDGRNGGGVTWPYNGTGHCSTNGNATFCGPLRVGLTAWEGNSTVLGINKGGIEVFHTNTTAGVHSRNLGDVNADPLDPSDGNGFIIIEGKSTSLSQLLLYAGNNARGGFRREASDHSIDILRIDSIGNATTPFKSVGTTGAEGTAGDLYLGETGRLTTVAGQLVLPVATGTAPLVVNSTTNVANLNASSLGGATFAAPGAIGGGTPAAGTFTTVSAGTSVDAPAYKAGGTATIAACTVVTAGATITIKAGLITAFTGC